MEFINNYYNYIIDVIIMMLGLWGMLALSNLVKKLISMAIFQTGIILFYISMGAKKGASIPIIKQAYDEHHHPIHQTINNMDYANPLTQILMLTAIVVGVATLGLGLALTQRVYSEHKSLHEDEILETLS